VGGSMQMEEALSAAGAVLACCSRENEVDLFDVASGQLRASWRTGFILIKKLAFSADGRSLVARGTAGHWTLSCFDLTADKPGADWPAPGAPWHDDLKCYDFALGPGGGRMALSYRDRVDVIELISVKRALRFTIEHVVKLGTISCFGPDAIGVHTDYGCASLYAVPRAAAASSRS
jgi:hypothetical protein